MTETSTLGRAEACANIALAKYWGKSPLGDNLTATSSFSLTLDALRTRTEVRLDSSLEADTVSLDGRVVTGRPEARVVALLDRFRALSGRSERAAVLTYNDFPTAAGLASSASGFAALVVAAAEAFDLELSAGRLSAEARRCSASAARSLFGGFAELRAEAEEASAFVPIEHWDVAMLVAVIAAGPKAIGSTGGMVHTAATSPYYPAWLACSESVFERVRAATAARDFERLAEAMEHSARLMHATMLTSEPPVLYLRGASVELMHELAARRAAGAPVAYTMDAGPNVKVLTLGSYVAQAQSLLRAAPGVSDVIVCRPGPGAARLAASGLLRDAARVTEVR
jgi:diphosphomevalonate decarboxylase